MENHQSRMLKGAAPPQSRESNQSARGNKKLKPELSQIRGGGSMSDMSICSIDFDISSTENGMLHHE